MNLTNIMRLATNIENIKDITITDINDISQFNKANNTNLKKIIIPAKVIKDTIKNVKP